MASKLLNQPKGPRVPLYVLIQRLLETSWKAVLTGASLQEWTTAKNDKYVVILSSRLTGERQNHSSKEVRSSYEYKVTEKRWFCTQSRD